MDLPVHQLLAVIVDVYACLLPIIGSWILHASARSHLWFHKLKFSSS